MLLRCLIHMPYFSCIVLQLAFHRRVCDLEFQRDVMSTSRPYESPSRRPTRNNRGQRPCKRQSLPTSHSPPPVYRSPTPHCLQRRDGNDVPHHPSPDSRHPVPCCHHTAQHTGQDSRDGDTHTPDTSPNNHQTTGSTYIRCVWAVGCR